jgi:tyrosyl-tRNA synthetase
LAPTKSEARRLIQQNGVKIDGETVTSIELELTAGLAAVLQVGKRKFVRINIT